jgi:hypothetical protein
MSLAIEFGSLIIVPTSKQVCCWTSNVSILGRAFLHGLPIPNYQDDEEGLCITARYFHPHSPLISLGFGNQVLGKDIALKPYFKFGYFQIEESDLLSLFLLN